MSVLITAHNREAFIGDAIKSALDSTFTDLEVIVVDDCSSDGTVEVAERFASLDNRVVVHRNERNLGDYANRNQAARYAAGTYLKFLDSDDWLYPYGLEFMVRSMSEHPSVAFGIGIETPDPAEPYPTLLSSHESYRRHFLSGGLLNSGPSATILDRQKFTDAGAFDELRFVGDESTWLKIAARHPVLLLPRDLVWWRRHSGQEFVLGLNAGQYLSAQFLVQMRALESPACPLDDAERRRGLTLVRRRHSRSLLRLAILERKGAECSRVMRSTGVSVPQLLEFAFARP